LQKAAVSTAYLAGMHAAQALIFEASARIYTSHGGVLGEFGRHDARVDVGVRALHACLGDGSRLSVHGVDL
jgi:uncharacterized protein (UPF0332 family)